MHTITVSKNNKPIYVKKLVNEELAEKASALFNKMITERAEDPESFSVVSEHDPDEVDTSVVNIKNGNPKYNKKANIESPREASPYMLHKAAPKVQLAESLYVKRLQKLDEMLSKGMSVDKYLVEMCIPMVGSFK